MKRVVDNKIILCPFCGKELREISYDLLLKRDNGKELIQFTLGCPNSGCETEVIHTTFMDYERGREFEEQMTFEDEMALDPIATGGE
ncbi:MAG: hypothetical protein KAJ93_01060 [Methanosarcinales archaeon]|nr:hypothetical protein [Methanosarcinales archaeon]